MAAPSGGVNCEEFAEFQVMGFPHVAGVPLLLSPDPVPCSGLGGICGLVVAEAGSSRLLFRAIGGHGGASLALGKEAAALGS